MKNLWNFLDRSKYDPAGIESVLQDYFSVTKVSDVMPNTNCTVTSVRLKKTLQG
jgi:hypothetical protein